MTATKIDTHPNPHARTYHLRRESTSELLAKLQSHLGVEDAYARRYQVSIFKAELHSWEEVERGVLFEIEAHESIDATLEKQR